MQFIQWIEKTKKLKIEELQVQNLLMQKLNYLEQI